VQIEELESALLSATSCPASEAEIGVPAVPGLYAILADSSESLPKPFCAMQRQRADTLIYIGIATVSLRQRLVAQDLRHRQASTFFRGMGSILGFKPPAGSLASRANKNNYQFSPSDTQAIIAWINRHVSVRWLELSSDLVKLEAELIRKRRPLLNTAHNPSPSAELAALRGLCRHIARGTTEERAT
jgi:hypothetical protein